jgi:hypothetical protein
LQDSGAFLQMPLRMAATTVYFQKNLPLARQLLSYGQGDRAQHCVAPIKLNRVGSSTYRGEQQ